MKDLNHGGGGAMLSNFSMVNLISCVAFSILGLYVNWLLFGWVRSTYSWRYFARYRRNKLVKIRRCVGISLLPGIVGLINIWHAPSPSLLDIVLMVWSTLTIAIVLTAFIVKVVRNSYVWRYRM